MTRPALFVDLDFDAALARSGAEGKLLLVDATATWCQPCQSMDRTTWSDPQVESRLRGLAVSIQLDVDADAATAKKLRIKSMPTVIVFRDGVELDRISGSRSPDALLAWIDDVVAGRKAIDRVREAAVVEADIHARYALFRALMDREEYAEATSVGVWLWESMLIHRPSMYGVRHSYFVTQLTDLVAAYPAAVPEIERLCELACAAGEESHEALRDWISLTMILGDEETLVSWFDDVVDLLADDARLARMVQQNVVPLLVARDRWRDVGRAYPDPMKALRGLVELGALVRKHSPGTPEAQQRMRDDETVRFRESVATIVRGLHAAERIDDARAFAAGAMAEDSSPEMARAIDDAARAQ